MTGKPTPMRVIVSVAILVLAGGGMVVSSTMNAGCTDGATPDCTGDASGSCGLLPNEGGDDDSGNATDSGAVDGGTVDGTMDMDTGSVDTDSGDDGGDDGGEAGD
jgi:hypothetical protein